MKRNTLLVPAIVTTALLAACGSDNNKDVNKEIEANVYYQFDSQFIEGESAISYTGQTARQVLIAELTHTIGGLERNSASVKDLLASYVYEARDDKEYTFSKVSNTIPGPTYGDISTGKNLVGKIAGGYVKEGEETRSGEYGTLQGELVGWAGVKFPINLVDLFINEIDALAQSSDGALGDIVIDKAYVDDKGRDYKQLIQKFLLGAVTFSQGTADYLKTNFKESNKQDGEKPYTKAEHKWDEAFGYFGAARDYSGYTDEEIAGKGGREAYRNGYFDTEIDGKIDLRSEINLANSTNCAKRDLGTKNSANPTDYTKEVFEAFVAGRKILNDAAKDVSRDLTDAEVTALNEQAVIAATVWEKCIAATVVHYINDTRADLMASNEPITAYADKAAYTTLAKHWSEMKGFALGLQFNPDSPFQKDQAAIDAFKKLHDLMGIKPVLPNGQGVSDQPLTDYLAGLLEARKILKDKYSFAEDHVANW